MLGISGICDNFHFSFHFFNQLLKKVPYWMVPAGQDTQLSSFCIHGNISAGWRDEHTIKYKFMHMPRSGLRLSTAPTLPG